MSDLLRESQIPVEPAIYKIISPHHNLVISLKDGNPRANLVVEKTPNSAPDNHKWAVICHFDGIYTFKSQIKKFEDRDIPVSKRPYARNSWHDESDPYIHSGFLDVISTYKIIPYPNAEGFFTISLPARTDVVWTIDDNADIVLRKYDVSLSKSQIWRFEKTENY